MAMKQFMLAIPVTAFAVAAHADEGMWLPSQTGALGPTLKERGLEIDPAALGDLKQAPLNAIASLGGCSAAFMSPQGLVASNHHCVFGSIQYNSTPERNYVRDGFLAKTFKDELPAAPGSRIYVIEDLIDVTARMNEGVTDALVGKARSDKLQDNMKTIVAECEEQPSRRCDVRGYYGGAVYYLQQRLEIKDVRLVYAPAAGIGDFGGEIDNWQWPRHTGDFGFYRAYVAPDGSSATYSKKNVPYKPKSWLKMAKEGVKDGDFIMLAGFPGTTDRLRTAAEADYYYSTYYPRQQALLASYSDQIMAATSGDTAAALKYASILAGADNFKKKLIGQMQGADAVQLSAQKRAREQAFRDWVAADAARTAQYGASIAALDAAVAESLKALSAQQSFSLINRGQLLSSARTLYRWAKEREKEDAKRALGYQDRDRQFVTDRLTQVERRYLPAVDRKLFEAALGEYRKLPDAARDAAFDAKLAEIGLDRLYAETKLADTVSRVGMLDMPASAFEASGDPFIKLAVALYPGDIAREEADEVRSGDMQKARAGYMAGMFAYAAENGVALYPDANGSLRFTYGNISGKARDGLAWTPFTTAEGVAAKQTGKEPFAAPQKAIDLIKAKNYGAYAAPGLGTLPVNYLSTVDITNGNSGSATLNAKGEFVGLAFDGTLDGVIADWLYEPSINRTIHVDHRYILWVMDKVDNAQRLLKEMGAK
jgi:hypothetical protein